MLGRLQDLIPKMPIEKPVDDSGLTPPIGSMPNPPSKGGIGGGGGGSAQDGLGQVNTGASTIASAIGQAQSALGGGGGSPPNTAMYKKGGSVNKNYTTGGKINLSSCGVSTAQKNKSQSNW